MALHCEPSPTASTVHIIPCGGTQGMEPMHQPATPDTPGMDRLTGDRR